MAATRRAFTVAVLSGSFLLSGAVAAHAAGSPAITPQQPSPGSSRTVGWDLTPADPTDALDCRLDGPSGVVLDWTPCGPTSFTATIDPAALDGDYTATVREQTISGPVTASDIYTLDTLAPADPTFTTQPTSPGTDSTLSWAWTLPEGSAECMLAGPSAAFSWTSCPGGAFSTPVSADGQYDFTVRTVDTAGNRSTGVTSTFLRDTTGPVVSVTVTPAVSNGSPAPTANFTIANTDSATCEVSQAGTVVVAAVSCTSPWSIPAASLTDGDYVVTVRASDSLGNPGAPASAGFRLDRVGPVDSPVITSGPGAAGNDPTPTWTFTVATGETAQCMFASPSQVLTSWMACSSPVTTSSLLGRPEVTYTLSIRTVDDAGNVGPTTTSDYRYDVTPPAAPQLALSASAGASTSVTASWPDSGTATCRVLRPDSSVASVVSPCTSPASLTVPSAETTYTIQVTVTDDAGNISAPASLDYLHDATPPAAPGVSGPASGNSTTPTFTITATEPGETFQCTWSLAGVANPPTACGPGAWATSPALSSDGPWSLSVVGTDTAGNTGPATTRGYLLDTGPPAAPVITLTGANPGSDVTPSWTFTAEPLATTECELLQGSVVLSTWGACPGGTISYDLTPADPTIRPDGDYTLRVRATDPAGNTGAAGSSSYTLDTIPPLAPSFVVQPTGPASSAATWVFSVGSDSAECQLLFDGTVTSSWSACSSPWTPSLGLDGDYELSVRAVDSARNIGPAVTSVGFVYDTSPPAMPVLTQSPASPSPDFMPHVGFTVGAGEVSECRIQRGGRVLVDWASCTSPWTADLTGQPDGSYSLEVRAVDPAGNRGVPLVVDYGLDSTAPPTAAFTSAPTGPASGRLPQFSFTIALGTTAECRVDGPLGQVADWSPCTSPYSLSLLGAPDGRYDLGVRLVDSAGNRSAVTTAGYLLDTTPPAAPVFGRLPASPTADPLSDWRWSGETSASASCMVRSGTRVVLGWRTCTSPHRLSLAGQPDGSYTFLVRLTDRAGNVGPARAATLILDTTAPVLVFTTVPGAVTTDRTPTWAWTAEPGVVVSCLLTRGQVVVVDWRTCSSSFTPSLVGFPDGTYRLSLRGVDRAGNMGAVVSNSTLLTSGTVTPPGGGTGGGQPTPPPPVPPVTAVGGGKVPDGGTSTPPIPPPAPSTTPSPKPSQSPASNPVPEGGSIVAPDPINRVPGLLGRVAVRSLDRPGIPVILLILVVVFLLVQNRIDRRDPKLANAPMGAEPTLGFGRLGTS